MVLEASTKFSTKYEFVYKLTNTSVQFTSTLEDPIYRFKTQHELAFLYCTVESYNFQFYITLVNWNLKFREIVDLRVAMDPQFTAKFLVATDSIMHLYLECCNESESLMDVSVMWLDTRVMFESI